MRNFRLVIAGYRIGFRASPEASDLSFPERFMNYADNSGDCDVIVNVHSGRFNVPEEAVRVFHSTIPEEIRGITTTKDSAFWSLYKGSDHLYLETTFPALPDTGCGCLKFSLGEAQWDLWIDRSDGKTDPVEYPLDGLILYYLTAINRDIMIHASGVVANGNGYLFSGISGRGKTTMAEIWSKKGADVIHDDRLIIRRSANGFSMYNTPVYRNDAPASCELKAIFLISHGNDNRIIPLTGSAAVSQLLANCIQHSWDETMISVLAATVSGLCTAVPVSGLVFRPDESVVDLILQNHG